MRQTQPHAFPFTEADAMMRANSYAVLLLGLIGLGIVSIPASAPVFAQEADDPAIADQQFETAAARYRKILEQRPQRGTAFDHWYRLYLDAGRLDELADSVRKQAEQQPENASAQLLLGLILERQGETSAALAAFETAETLAPDNYYPALVRGELLARQSNWDEAAAALSRAIERNPPRTELLDIYKQLGRVQLRHGRTDAALKTFAQLADKFPGDHRILTELAELLTQEEQFEQAIQRWRQMAEAATDDPYRRTTAQIQIARLHVRDGKHGEAVELYDQALEHIRPDSWLADEICRGIEEAFLKNDDLPGLVEYYRQRLKRHPDDLQAMLQLARGLAQSRQPEEALAQYRAAVKLAPSRRDLREALIGQLVRGRKYQEAIAECQALTEIHPDDVEVLLRLGDLHLQAAYDEDREQAERDAVAVWERIAAIRPDDPALAVQTAEACRRGMRTAQLARLLDAEAETSNNNEGNRGLTPPGSPLLVAAEKYYREAVRRGRGAAQYHEYLGEFLHTTGRKTEAVAAWSQIAAGPNAGATAWQRLAEVYDGFGYLQEAVEASREAVSRESDNFDYRDFQVGLLVQQKEYDKALAHIDEMRGLADTPHLEEKAIARQVEIYVAADRVAREIARLQKQLEEQPGTLADLWLLALLLADQSRFGEAAARLEQAIKAAPDDPRLLTYYARMLERSNQPAQAVAQYRRLITLEPKNRTKYYERIVHLELEQGRGEEAREAADQLLQYSRSNVDSYLLRAAVAFRLGDVDDGLDTLRQAVRLAPQDVTVRSQLARELAEHKRPQEALEHYWRCFELAHDVNEKFAHVTAMAKLAGRSGTVELIDRLRRLRDRQEDPRELTLCVVEALRQVGQTDLARQELTSLLTNRADDVEVLTLLVDLAASERNWKSALNYQNRIVELTGDAASLNKLAGFHTSQGDHDAAADVWKRILIETGDADAIVQAVDQRLRQGQFDQALYLADWGAALAPSDWRLSYQAAHAEFALQRNDAAAKRFEEFLEVTDAMAAAMPAAATSQPQTAGAQSMGGVPINMITTPGATVTVNSSGQIVWVDQTFRGAYSNSTTRILGGGGTIVYTGAVAGFRGHRLFQDFSAATTAYSRLNTLQTVSRASSNRSSTNSRASQQMQSRLRAAIHLPADLSAARITAAVALLITARQQAREAQWREQMEAAGRDNPTRLRLLVMAYVGTTLQTTQSRVADDLAMMQRIAEQLPDDPLPRLAVFHLLAHYSSRSRTSNEVQEQRAAALRESFRWLEEQRPDLVPHVGFTYARQMIAFGDGKSAADLIVRMIDKSQTLPDLTPWGFLALGTGHPDVCRRFLLRSAEMVPALDPADAQTLEQVQTAMQVALSPHFFDYTDDDGESVVALFERFMDAYLHQRRNPTARRPAGSRAGARVAVPGPQVRTGRLTTRGNSYSSNEMRMLQTRMRALEQEIANQMSRPAGGQVDAARLRSLETAKRQLQLQMESLQRGGGRTPVQLFPNPNAYVDARLYALLMELEIRLRGASQSALLIDRLEQRIAKADEHDRPVWRTAQIFALWWSGEKQTAVDLLRDWCEAKPDDVERHVELAEAQFSTGGSAQSLRTIHTIDGQSHTLNQRLARVRFSISQSILQSSDEQLFEALLAELKADGRPHLELYFADPRSLTQPPGVPVAASSSTPTLPGVLGSGRSTYDGSPDLAAFTTFTTSASRRANQNPPSSYLRGIGAPTWNRSTVVVTNEGRSGMPASNFGRSGMPADGAHSSAYPSSTVVVTSHRSGMSAFTSSGRALGNVFFDNPGRSGMAASSVGHSGMPASAANSSGVTLPVGSGNPSTGITYQAATGVQSASATSLRTGADARLVAFQFDRGSGSRQPSATAAAATARTGNADDDRGGPLHNTPIIKVLNYARMRDAQQADDRKRLAELEQAAAAQWKKHPQHAQLAALVALTRFHADDVAGALTAARQWAALPPPEPGGPQTHEKWLLITACLQHSQTQRLGRDLAMKVVSGDIAPDDVPLLRVVLADWTKTLIESDGRADAERLVRQLFKATPDASTRQNAAAVILLVCDLSRSIHSKLLPLFCEELVRSVKALPPGPAPGVFTQPYERNRSNVENAHPLILESEEWMKRLRAAGGEDEPKLVTFVSTQLWMQPLQTAVSRALPYLDPQEAKRILASLQALLFPAGIDKDAVLYRWQDGTSAGRAGSLGQAVIELAARTGGLAQLRKTWDAHPSSDSMTLLALRAEAAIALEDFEAADALLDRLDKVRRETGEIPPVWSLRAIYYTQPDRGAAVWALDLGGGGSVQTSPGGVVRRSDGLPKGEFTIKEISLISNGNVTDDGLRNLARLYELESLRLSYTPITDEGLVHIAKLPNLRYLSLGRTAITDEGLKHFYGMKSLRLLILQKSKVTAAGIKALQAALPDCEIDFE
jgi:tetratricopeptide (TPR) repeat protein